MPNPKKGVAYEFDMYLVDQTTGQFKYAPTIESGDFKVSKDNGSLVNLTTLPSVAPAAGPIVRVQLSASEMTADKVSIVAHDAAGSEWNDVLIVVEPTSQTIDDVLATVGYTAPDNAGISSAAASASSAVTKATAIQLKTDNLPASPAAVSDIPSASTVAAAVWAYVVEAGYSAASLLRLIVSSACAKVSGMGSNAPKFRDLSDAKDRITATTDQYGNRSAVTIDPT